ncbi:MAG: diguanylate cyclase [candidate division Zixibacteria bacterium]|nr:diguanylate cyclase [Gammaproteobacteria bacterium]NIX58139.1 diguanylate cyclase [candidate division Zixibacteria bacterium]
MSTPIQTQDDLTGAMSRETFEPRLEAALQHAVQNQTHLSLAMVDIDQFLLINENYGNQIGDQVLINLHQKLGKGTSEDTLIFRYGGDEFSLILPGMTREQALLAIEHIRLDLAEPDTYDSQEFAISISAGIASYPIDGSAMDEIQRKAYQALYRAKKEGRGKILLAYDEKMIPKTVHFTETQLERLTKLANDLSITEARLLREALDDLINKYTVNKIEA